MTRDTKTGRFAKGNGRAPAFNERVFVEQLVENAAYSLATRAKLARAMGDPRRDIDDECGYPKTESLDFAEYDDMYQREPIAARVVDIYPNECWSVSPEVYELEQGSRETEFEQAWDALGRNLRGEPGHYSEEEGSAVWEYLYRVDVMSRKGRYGVLLLGFDDAKPLDLPVEKAAKLNYLRCYDEGGAEVVEWVDDDKDPRNGYPLSYNLKVGDGPRAATRKVHYSRVVHVADGLAGSEVYARPSLQTCWNRLYDLRKTYGAAGQGYWDAGLPFRTIESHPQYGDIEWPKDLREQIEKTITGLQRWMALKAVTLKTHPPGVLAPGPFVDPAIQAICIMIDCPLRIFIGSERGELASSQDERKWYGTTIPRRQNLYLTPRLIVPFVNRLIRVGVLPEPKDGFRVAWPEMITLRPDEQAKIAESRAKATAAALQSGMIGTLMTELDFLTRELGYGDEEAREMLVQVAAMEPEIPEESVEEEEVE